MAIQAELILIVGYAQEESVGVEVRCMAANACQRISAAGSQGTRCHGCLERQLGSGRRHNIGPFPTMGGLVEPLQPAGGVVFERIGLVSKSQRIYSRLGITGSMAGLADVVVAGAAQGELSRMAGHTGKARGRIVVGCINRASVERRDEEKERQRNGHSHQTLHNWLLSFNNNPDICNLFLQTISDSEWADTVSAGMPMLRACDPMVAATILSPDCRQSSRRLQWLMFRQVWWGCSGPHRQDRSHLAG